MILFADDPVEEAGEQNQQGKELAPIVPASTDPMDLTRYNITDEAIQKYEEEYLIMKVTDINDKKYLKQVYEARQFIKKKRTAVEAVRKDLVADALAWQNKANAEAKRITTKLRIIEDHLQAQEDFAENEKARIAKEAAEEKAALIRVRVELLMQLNMAYDGSGWQIGPHYISNHEVESLSIDEFNVFQQKAAQESSMQAAAKLILEKEQAEKDAELERQRRELEQQRQAQHEAQKKLEEQQAAIKAESERVAKEAEELKRQKLQVRKDQLCAYGMQFNGTSYVFLSVEVRDEINKYDDITWGAFLLAVYSDITAAKAKEKECAEEQKAIREKEIEAEKEKAAQEAAAAERERIENELKAKAAADEAERLEIIRQTNLLPDKVKLQGIAIGIQSFITDLPVVVSEEAQVILKDICLRLNEISESIIEESNSM